MTLPDSQPMQALEGTGKAQLTFEDIDQKYHLKIRSFIRLGMSSVFTALENEVNLAEMRTEGMIPIMFFLQFRAEPTAVALLSRVKTAFQVHLRRAQPASPGVPGRLLLDMEVDIHGEESTGDPKLLGGGPRSERMVKAGRLRGLHVITSPMAPPDARFPADVPGPLRALAETPLAGPYPNLELLNTPPEGMAAGDPGPWKEHRTVWGMQNTDVNQHVNVQEYIHSLEDHFTRLLFGAGHPPRDHRITSTDILFRKPFFRGQPCCLRGDLYVGGNRTLMLGGVHPMDPEGGVVDTPSVFTRMEGAFFDEG